MYFRFFLLAIFIGLANIAHASDSYKGIRFVDDNGNTKMSAYVVPEGSTKINSTTIALKTGDKFKIELNISKEGYIYIYGVDSEGKFEELVRLGKSKHYFNAGNHILPPNGSFELLGDGKMKEELYFVVNKDKLNVCRYTKVF
ncbi:DUF4384 domain-containing protein [Candidatus Halobeggiatoa sp. HSG11]|nr:DUF4384 domain-containing protein [Candidatus Halobeggiatoa sp. HSG11]